MRSVGRSSESRSAAFVMKLRSEVIGGHMWPAGPVYWHRRCARPVAWTLLSYCETLALAICSQPLMIIEMRSTKLVSQTITAILLQRCSRCLIRSRTSLSTYVTLDVPDIVLLDVIRLIDRITTSTYRSIFRRFSSSVQPILLTRSHHHSSIDAS